MVKNCWSQFSFCMFIQGLIEIFVRLNDDNLILIWVFVLVLVRVNNLGERGKDFEVVSEYEESVFYYFGWRCWYLF